MRALLFVSALCFAVHARADDVIIYKCKTDKGVEYSSIPCKNDPGTVVIKHSRPAKSVESGNDVGLEKTSCNVASTYHTAAAGNVVNRTQSVKTAVVKITFYRDGAVLDTAEKTITLAPWRTESWRIVGGNHGQEPPDQCQYDVSWK
jgi:hypothetical protein